MKRSPIPAAIRREEDPEWRSWFQDVQNRKNDLKEERQKVRISVLDDDEREKKRIVRPASTLQPVKKILSRSRKKSGLALVLDCETLTRAWQKAAGVEIAAQSAVLGFKNGVLTIAVASAALLQEIRQFQQKPLLAALRERWVGTVPLLRVVYRAGGKRGE